MSDVKRLIDKALAEAQAVWEPRLTSALEQVAELEATLAAEQAKHRQYVRLGANQAKTIEAQQTSLTEYRELVDELRARLPRVEARD